MGSVQSHPHLAQTLSCKRKRYGAGVGGGAGEGPFSPFYNLTVCGAPGDLTHNAKAATIECRKDLGWKGVDSCVCGPGVRANRYEFWEDLFGAGVGGGSHRFQTVRDAGMEGWGLDH